MIRAALSLAILALAAGDASAQSAPARKAARELMDYLRSRFAREVAEEGAEKLERRFARAWDSFGDDAIKAARKLGPKTTLEIVEKHGKDGARILLQHGDRGARLLTRDSVGTLKVYRALGNDGIDLMLKRHGEITAARLPDLAPQIAASGRSRDILAVLEKYGDRACSFIWRNKGTIFASAALAAFLANPAPYLEGAKDIAAGTVGQVAASTNWTSVFIAATALAAGLAAFRMLILRRPLKAAPST